MRVTILPLMFFPDKAYFNLIREVDHVVFDTEGVYTKGTVNRTKLADDRWLTLPIHKPGKPGQPVQNIRVWWGDREWHGRMVQRLADVYGSEYLESNQVFQHIVNLNEGDEFLARTLYRSVKAVMDYFNINTPTSPITSWGAKGLHGQRRAIRVCRVMGADEFVQPGWNRRYYDPVAFDRMGVRLNVSEDEEFGLSVLDDCFTWWR